MSNLEDIFKQKVEQFEVPYNEAHWNAVEAQLNNIKLAKLKKNIFLAASTVAVIGFVGYLLYNSNDTTINTVQTEDKAMFFEQPKSTIIENNNNHSNEVKENNSHLSEKALNNIDYVDPIKIDLDNNNLNTEEVVVSSTSFEKKEVVSSTLNAEFIVYNNKVCLGEESVFEAIEKKNLTYQWDFGDGTFSTSANPNHTYQKEGNFTVSLTITNKENGKSTTNTIKNAVEIFPIPNSEFSYTEEAEQNDANKLKYPYTVFESKVKDLDSYSWLFSDNQKSSSTNTKILFDKKTSYKATLTVKNSYGCSNSITKTVVNEHPFNLFAPNAFSPNRDGDNDTFIPKGLITWDVQFEMFIKNKSGEIVFKTTDKENGWNGKLNNTGVELETGIYFWQVITYDAEGIPHQHYGKLNLIR